jgi:hypothetical protein
MKSNSDLRSAVTGAELLVKSANDQRKLLARMRQNAARLSAYLSLTKARLARREEPRATASRVRPYSRTGIFQ